MFLLGAMAACGDGVVGVFDGVGAAGVMRCFVTVWLLSAEGEYELEAVDLVLPRPGVLWGGALL